MNVIGTLVLTVSFLIGVVLITIRRTRYFGLALVFVTGSAIAFFVWQSYRWQRGFDVVALGATEHEVISLVGAPQRITDGTLWVEPGFKKSGTELVPGCTKEYWYNVFYFPVAYSFCFNERSLLIDKYNWVLW